MRRLGVGLFVVLVVAVVALSVAVIRKDANLDRLHDRSEKGNLHQAAWDAGNNPDNRHLSLVPPSSNRSDSDERLDVVVTTTGQGFVLKNNLHSPGASRIHQLWAVTPGKVISLGVLPPRIDNPAFVVPEDATELQVSLEPRPGEVTQTQTPLLVAKL